VAQTFVACQRRILPPPCGFGGANAGDMQEAAAAQARPVRLAAARPAAGARRCEHASRADARSACAPGPSRMYHAATARSGGRPRPAAARSMLRTACSRTPACLRLVRRGRGSLRVPPGVIGGVAAWARRTRCVPPGFIAGSKGNPSRKGDCLYVPREARQDVAQPPLLGRVAVLIVRRATKTGRRSTATSADRSVCARAWSRTRMRTP
jgi:hypothetical protein